jgi:hypothetical protein
MSEILVRTPIWVWGILAALITLGLMLARDRQVNTLRLLIPSAALSVYSFVGAAIAFPSPMLAIAVWIIAAFAAALLVRPNFDAALSRLRTRPREAFPVPGSLVPLALFLGIFGVRYVLNVMNAINPGLVANPLVILGFAGLLGLFSGLLVNTSLRRIGAQV